MTHYHCYFLRPATLQFGAPTAIDTAEDFPAETDDQARLIAEAMYRRRCGETHGFEVWRGTTLVYRQRAALQKN